MRLVSLCLALSALGSVVAFAQPPTYVVAPFPQRRSDRFTTRDGLPAGRVTGIKMRGAEVVAETAQGQATFESGAWRNVESNRRLSFELPPVDMTKLPTGARVLSAAVGRDKSLWMVTDRGAFHSEGDKYAPFTKPKSYLTRQDQLNIDTPFTFVTTDSNGHVWFGTTAGAYMTDGANYWRPFDRRNGMPWENTTCLAFGPNAELWVGTTEGVCRYSNAAGWMYYKGPRWLPNDRVNAIAVAPDGSAWVATEEGVAHLYDKRMTLEEKAAHYEEITARHNRRGYVTGGTLKTPGDPKGGVIHEASDNDGLWTACYVAAESFRWAATHDPAARALAHKSMFAMLDLMRLSGVSGFPARAVIFKGEAVSGYSADETVRIPGETEKIWYPSPVDPNVLCKGDTSSDELDGHYFAWLVFYDLVADDAEKKAVREAVRACTDNIVGHDLFLFGHTGRRTLWGVWNPAFLNDSPDWWEERGINSLEILSYLLIADHVTGDPKYKAKFAELVEKHHYLLNEINAKVADPWWGVNHSDDQMEWMMHYAILTLEKDPDTRLCLLQSAERSFGVVRPENSPFFNFVYGARTGRKCGVEEAVSTLEDWPWELISWSADNSHRTDVGYRSVVFNDQTKTETERVLPYSERHILRWNGNPYEISGGDRSGKGEDDGSAWLLPYWLGRYHHLIAEGK